MGFFKKLFGGFGNKKQTVAEENNINTTVNDTPTSDEYDTDIHSVNVYHNQNNTGDEYFAELINQDNFPGYVIEKNLHPSFFDDSAHPSCLPISYLFKKDNTPVLAVLVMQRNHYRAMIALGTYKILEENNIKYIRFFKGMENKEDYVINRIKENLN